MIYTYVYKDIKQKDSVQIYALYFDPFKKLKMSKIFESKNFQYYLPS